MKDFLANDIKVGDLVASTAAGYCSLHVWTVIKVNPKTVQLQRKADRWDGVETVRRAREEFILIRVSGD